jgi:Skp family chaperone for outer membrane proteins
MFILNKQKFIMLLTLLIAVTASFPNTRCQKISANNFGTCYNYDEARDALQIKYAHLYTAAPKTLQRVIPNRIDNTIYSSEPLVRIRQEESINKYC